jgi:hypothetical protein
VGAVLTVWRVAALAALAGLIALLIVNAASAHSWYEPRCCSDKDCSPLPHTNVRINQDGFVILIPGAAKAQMIPFADPRVRMIPSDAPPEDAHRFHACTVQGKPDGRILCLYVPQGGA